MGILSSTIGAMKAAGKGAATITSGLISAGETVSRATGGILNALTGGPRAQTYGYLSQFYPEKRKKYSTKPKVTKIRREMPTLAKMPEYGSSSEKLNQIFDFMKRSQEKQIRQLEVQKSFNEERTNEEERRHKELLGAIEKFVSIQTVTRVDSGDKKDDGGLLDMIKNMVAGLIENVTSKIQKMAEWLEGISWLRMFTSIEALASRILGIIATPFGATLLLAGSAAALIYMLRQNRENIKANPNAPENLDNPLARKERGELTRGEGQGGQVSARKALRKIPRPEIEDTLSSPLNYSDSELMDLYGATREQLANWLKSNPNEKYFQGRVAAISGATKTGFEAGSQNASQVAPIASASSFNAGGGRGGDSQMADYMARRMEETGDTKASQTAKPFAGKRTAIPSTPPAVASAIDENRNLQMQASTSTGPTTPLIASSQSSTQTKEPPLPATAEQRDSEAIAGYAFTLQKRRARAY